MVGPPARPIGPPRAKRSAAWPSHHEAQSSPSRRSACSSRSAQPWRGHASMTTAGQPPCHSTSAVTSCWRWGRRWGTTTAGVRDAATSASAFCPRMGDDHICVQQGVERRIDPAAQLWVQHGPVPLGRLLPRQLEVLPLERVTAGPGEHRHSSRTRSARLRLGDREPGQGSDGVHPVQRRRRYAAQHAGRLGWPASDDRVGHVEPQAVRRVAALTGPRHRHDWDAVQSDQHGHLDGHVDDEDGGCDVPNPGGDLGHPRAKAAVSDRHPVQAVPRGPLHVLAVPVVPLQLDPRTGPASGRGQRREAGDRLAECVRDSARTVQMSVAHVVDVVADQGRKTILTAPSCFFWKVS